MAGVEFRRSYTFDADLQLKDSGAVSSSGQGQVGGSDRHIDVGKAVFFSMCVIDVSAIEIADDDELYKLEIHGGDKSDFSGNTEVLAVKPLGANQVLTGNVDSTVGRYELPVINVQNGVVYPYLRIYHNISGTVGTGIDYTAFMALPV
jgi:hypothetical protein